MAKQTEERSYEGIPPKVERVTEELTVELTQKEWEGKVEEFARAQKLTESTKERKKSVMADLNADLKIAEVRESQLANIVTSRQEQRDVTVEVTHDYEAGKVTYVRTDTKDLLRERDMTTLERQGGLFDQEAEEEAGVTDAADFTAAIHEENKNTNTRNS